MVEREIGPGSVSIFATLHREIRRGLMPEPEASRIVNHEHDHWVRLPREADTTVGVLEQKVTKKGRYGPVTIYLNTGAFVKINNINTLDPDKVIESAEAVGSEMSEADKKVAKEAKIRKYKASLEKIRFGRN